VPSTIGDREDVYLETARHGVQKDRFITDFICATCVAAPVHDKSVAEPLAELLIDENAGIGGGFQHVTIRLIAKGPSVHHVRPAA
jgi:hypothetical protein